MRSKSGFTIVELLIVVVVIAILATISVVAYSGIQTRALNMARNLESQQWHKILQLYRAYEGHLPTVPSQSYCLGSGFPNGDANPGGECRDYASPPNAYHEIDNTVLMNELKKASPSLPSGPRTPINGSIGPYLTFWGNGYSITNFFQGKSSSDCPAGTTFVWTDGATRTMCEIVFQI